MAGQLHWNGNEYEIDYDGKRKLYVDGDAFAEARMDLAREYAQEAHPKMSEDQVHDWLSEGTEEGDTFFDRAFNETLDPDSWSHIAVELDSNGEPIDPRDRGQSYDAWIQ